MLFLLYYNSFFRLRIYLVWPCKPGSEHSYWWKLQSTWLHVTLDKGVSKIVLQSYWTFAAPWASVSQCVSFRAESKCCETLCDHSAIVDCKAYQKCIGTIFDHFGGKRKKKKANEIVTSNVISAKIITVKWNLKRNKKRKTQPQCLNWASPGMTEIVFNARRTLNVLSADTFPRSTNSVTYLK